MRSIYPLPVCLSFSQSAAGTCLPVADVTQAMYPTTDRERDRLPAADEECGRWLPRTESMIGDTYYLSNPLRCYFCCFGCWVLHMLFH